jgi:hypothetical protein
MADRLFSPKKSAAIALQPLVFCQQELLLGPMNQWLSRPLLCGLMRRKAVALRPLERLIRLQVLKDAVINRSSMATTKAAMMLLGRSKWP